VEVHAWRQGPKAENVSQSCSRSFEHAIRRFRMKALTFKTKGGSSRMPHRSAGAWRVPCVMRRRINREVTFVSC